MSNRSPVARLLHAIGLGVVSAGLLSTLAPATAVAQGAAVATPAAGVELTLPVVERVRLASGIDVELVQAERGSTSRITLSGPAEGVARIGLRVEDGVLHIDAKPCHGICLNTLRGVRARVVASELKGFEIRGSGSLRAASLKLPMLDVAVAGSGDARVQQLQVQELDARVAGSGDFTASGQATRQRIAVAGSGDAHLGQLQGRDVVVKVAGSGDAQVWAEQSLVAAVAGSGDVVYRGNPTHKQISRAGSGSIRVAR